jgi:UDP-N-acetylmuramate dehydrogenase
VSDLGARLEQHFGADRVRRHVPLAPMTTFKVGGPAEAFIETHSEQEILAALKIAHAAGAKVTMLGGGSNVLISDQGVRGLVIRPKGGDVSMIGSSESASPAPSTSAFPATADTSAALVRADAAVTINGLVRWTINRGYAGLEAWAGTPGTVGGAIYGNAHWKGTNIGDLVESVRLARPDGKLLQVPADRMEFDYDYSRLKHTGEVVLWAAFRVAPGGDPSALREVARESLAFRKRTQPLESPSAGCIFMNPDRVRDRVPDGIPPSAGALVDRAGLKGMASNGARVSPTHANFIINDGSATASDIRALIERCRTAVKDRFGVMLRNEIVYLGEFDY